MQYEIAGAYKNQKRSEDKLRILVSLAMVIVFLIPYMQFRTVSTALIIFSGVALCVAGGFSLIWLYSRPWFLDFYASRRVARLNAKRAPQTTERKQPSATRMSGCVPCCVSGSPPRRIKKTQSKLPPRQPKPS
ncbi:MAG: hypothetical protein GY811_29320 [Myxococcales bacterium]|nr:hypothetical protein [Myxococcales bacterium]